MVNTCIYIQYIAIVNADPVSIFPATRTKTAPFSEPSFAAKCLIFLAERVGFEPTVRGYRTPDFESGTFDHSATSPGASLAATRSGAVPEVF